ncbi:MAG: glycosyltransferase [Rhodospirillaceae bacterium]
MAQAMAPEAPLNGGRTAVLVAGMHRSGTSAITGVLNLLGFELPANLMPAQEDNRPGYWESLDVVQLNDALLSGAGSAWDNVLPVATEALPPDAADRVTALLAEQFAETTRFVVKDPRICRLLPVWLQAGRAVADRLLVVLPIRHPLEVAASLSRRDGFSTVKGVLLWLGHVLEAERESRGERRSILAFQDLLEDWRGTVLHLADDLGVDLGDAPAEAIDAFVDPSHRHQIAPQRAPADAVEDLAQRVYAALRAGGPEMTGVLDAARDEAAALLDGPMRRVLSDEMAARHVASERLDRTRAEYLGEIERLQGEFDEKCRHIVLLLEENEHLRQAVEEARVRHAEDLKKHEEILSLGERLDSFASDLTSLSDRVETLEVEGARRAALVSDQVAEIMERADRSAEVARRAGSESAAAVARVERLIDDALRRSGEQLAATVKRSEQALAAACDEASITAREAAAKAARTAAAGVAQEVVASALLANTERKALAGLREAALLRRMRDLEGRLGAGVAPRRRRPGALAGSQARLLYHSPLFDADYYVARYSDVLSSRMSPWEHYLAHGAREGRDPHPLFSTSWYLLRNADIARARLNPLVHFIRFGAAEGRDPHPLFDLAFYRQQCPEAAAPGVNPLEHFLREGAARGLRPHWLFDTSRYAAEHPELGNANPLADYVINGAWDSRSPHWAFDPDHYIAQYPEVLHHGLNPLIHFLTDGWRLGLRPNADFDTNAYVEAHPELTGCGDNPLVHYVRGIDYGRVMLGAEGAVPLAAGSGVSSTGPAPGEAMPASALVEMLDLEWGVEARNTILARMRRFRLPFHTAKKHPAPPTDAEIADWIAEIECLSPSAPVEAPDVSIIIPVYNQLAFTLGNIASVLASPTRYSYEIIVADDCSTDQTGPLMAGGVGQVRHVRGETNQGFIRNCNAGARAARGRFLVFLNNDTFVLPGWLDEMIGTVEADPAVGLVGSKLVYPDGRLQEAGGIIWRDASAWNFGRYDQVRKPEYSYLRDVDYVSGASIAVPRPLWDEMGGFDEWYDVAYGEDSDLALRIRQSGRRVVLQPLSMLIHFEGISSGTDVTQGVKAYQVSNARKIAERWADVLATHRPNGERPDLEKERPVGRRVLVIDHCTPTPDQDAGSLTCLEIMRAFQANDFKVTFIPEDNFLFMPKETRNLQRIGIEAVYYPFYTSVEQYLSVYGALFDVVLIFRNGAAGRHLDTVRRLCPQARVVFHNSDLHYLREEREAALKGNPPELVAAAAETRRQELAIINAVDTTVVHSTAEQEMLAEAAPKAKVYVFPWILDPVGRDTEFKERHGLMFLGGYRHTPNVDAVLYFVREVWPLVRARLSDVTFYAVGSHAPREITDLDGRNGVRVVGFVQDLRPLLAEIRLSVAPIRYGAGIKGKVAMSMAYGVPVVGTACAAEGMGLTLGSDVIVADDPAEMADAIAALYENETLWTAVSDAGLDFIARNYSSALGKRRVAEIATMAGMCLDH